MGREDGPRDWPPGDEPPHWLELTDALMGVLVSDASRLLESSGPRDPDLRESALLALRHFAGSLQFSATANRDGLHTVALGLARHMIESMTVVELALPCSGDAGDRLLIQWRDGVVSLGQIRKYLERDVWDEYGSGLWQEAWAVYFGNLAAALQPYAHCTSALLEWGVLTWKDGASGKILGVSGRYDALKASRITLLHGLLTWSLGRLTTKSGAGNPGVLELGLALSQSSLLFDHQSDWDLQFRPHMFFNEEADA